jgi:hypothetical protein
MSHSSVYLPMRRLIWIAPLTVFVSVAAVLFVRVIAVAVLHPAPTFAPLGLWPPIFDTAVLVTWAVIVFAGMVRFASDPLRKFKIVSVCVLVFSFVPDITLAMWHWFGGTWTYAFALMTMHVAAWAVCVTVLIRLGPIDVAQLHNAERSTEGRL